MRRSISSVSRVGVREESLRPRGDRHKQGQLKLPRQFTPRRHPEMAGGPGGERAGVEDLPARGPGRRETRGRSAQEAPATG